MRYFITDGIRMEFSTLEVTIRARDGRRRVHIELIFYRSELVDENMVRSAIRQNLWLGFAVVKENSSKILKNLMTPNKVKEIGLYKDTSLHNKWIWELEYVE